MKKILILLIVGLSIACSATRGSQDTANSRKAASSYKIKKIVDEKEFVIIYAKRNDSTFKIVNYVTDSTVAKGRNKIKVGKSYHLDLIKMYPPKDGTLLLGKPTTPNLGVSMGMANGKNVRLEYESHYKIYSAQNMDGLYLKEE